MKYIKYILLTAIATASLGAGARNSITSALESSVVEMGSYVGMDVQAVVPDGSTSDIFRFSDVWPAEVELRPDSSMTTRSVGNGMTEMTRHYVLQSFDSGVYVLPPFLLVVDNDTLLSNAISLKVNPVDVTELEDIHPMASVVDGSRRWYDFLPDWITDNWGWIAGGILVIALGVIAVLIFTHRLRVPFIPERKPEPPYDQAKRLLAILREEHLWEKGRSKEYYSDLTDILRRYISRRYDINAMEMTSAQLLRALRAIPELDSEIPGVKAVLDTADFVKFARMQPNPEVNVKAFDTTDRFIETTRPVETPEADPGVTKEVQQK